MHIIILRKTLEVTHTPRHILVSIDRYIDVDRVSNSTDGGFPISSVAKMLHFHCRGHGFEP